MKEEGQRSCEDEGASKVDLIELGAVAELTWLHSRQGTIG